MSLDEGQRSGAGDRARPQPGPEGEHPRRYFLTVHHLAAHLLGTEGSGHRHRDRRRTAFQAIPGYHPAHDAGVRGRGPRDTDGIPYQGRAEIPAQEIPSAGGLLLRGLPPGGRGAGRERYRRRPPGAGRAGRQGHPGPAHALRRQGAPRGREGDGAEGQDGGNRHRSGPRA